MDSTTQMAELLGLAGVLAGQRSVDLVLAAGLPAALALAGADSVLVLSRTADGPRVARNAGQVLDEETARELDVSGEAGLRDVVVPPTWAGRGIVHVASHRLPADAGVLVLAWRVDPAERRPPLQLALAILDGGLARVQAQEGLHDLAARVEADRERERIAARFQGLVDSAPDAILVLDEDEQVLEANQRAHELLGGDPQGHSIQEILPGWPHAGTSGVQASDLGGAPLPLDVITVGVGSADEHDAGQDTLSALFLRDASSRLEGEAAAARLGEAQLRRRQALEINDNVVQGLVAAVYALDQGEVEASMSYLDRTLTAARAMMDDLLDPLDGAGLQPGDLVRTAPAVIGPMEEPEPGPEESGTPLQRSHSVLVVDDAEDLRMLLRTRMESYNGLTVVGEAADGISAVQMASELQPDLVLLDLAMPRMDGLEALPLIRAAVPGVRVIVLSGFNQSTLAQKALEAGADHYVVKGGSMSRLLELVDSLLEPAS
jgi:CheY-like chemotaxis protein/PAS domain-containing protein